MVPSTQLPSFLPPVGVLTSKLRFCLCLCLIIIITLPLFSDGSFLSRNSSKPQVEKQEEYRFLYLALQNEMGERLRISDYRIQFFHGSKELFTCDPERVGNRMELLRFKPKPEIIAEVDSLHERSLVEVLVVSVKGKGKPMKSPQQQQQWRTKWKVGEAAHLFHRYEGSHLRLTLPTKAAATFTAFHKTEDSRGGKGGVDEVELKAEWGPFQASALTVAPFWLVLHGKELEVEGKEKRVMKLPADLLKKDLEISFTAVANNDDANDENSVNAATVVDIKELVDVHSVTPNKKGVHIYSTAAKMKLTAITISEAAHFFGDLLSDYKMKSTTPPLPIDPYAGSGLLENPTLYVQVDRTGEAIHTTYTPVRAKWGELEERYLGAMWPAWRARGEPPRRESEASRHLFEPYQLNAYYQEDRENFSMWRKQGDRKYLNPECFLELRGTQWLTQEIILFYAELLRMGHHGTKETSSRFTVVPHCYLLYALEQVQGYPPAGKDRDDEQLSKYYELWGLPVSSVVDIIDNNDWLFFFVQRRQHWMLVSARIHSSAEERRIDLFHYDSWHPAELEWKFMDMFHLRKLLANHPRVVGQGWTFTERIVPDIPKQKDEHECGPHVCYFMKELITKGHVPPASASISRNRFDPYAFRMEMAEEIAAATEVAYNGKVLTMDELRAASANYKALMHIVGGKNLPAAATAAHRQHSGATSAAAVTSSARKGDADDGGGEEEEETHG